MIISPDILRKEMIALLSAVDKQIEEVKKEADSKALRPEQIRDEYGNWPMITLLSTKVNALSTLAQLNQNDRSARTTTRPQRSGR